MFKILNNSIRVFNFNYVCKFDKVILNTVIKNITISQKMFKSKVYNLQEATKDEIQTFLNSFDTVLADCDGNYLSTIQYFTIEILYNIYYSLQTISVKALR